MSGGTLTDLSDRELTSLLKEIESLDALPSTDVESVPVSPISPRRGSPLMRRVLLVVALSLPFVAGSLEAPGWRGAAKPSGSVASRAQASWAQPPADAPALRRQQLEQRVRQSLWRAWPSRRIGFTDEQMLRLERTSQRFDVRRREHSRRRRRRNGSRSAPRSSRTAARIKLRDRASSLAKIHDVQQQRLEMQSEEQAEAFYVHDAAPARQISRASGAAAGNALPRNCCARVRTQRASAPIPSP